MGFKPIDCYTEVGDGYITFNPYGKSGFAPFEMTSSVIEALAWCCMLILIGLETKTYILEFRWYVRFGVLYVLVGDAVVLNLIIGVTDYYSGSSLYLYISTVCCQVLFGILLLFMFLIWILIRATLFCNLSHLTLLNMKYYRGKIKVCPERHANIFSRIYFGWMTPLMQLGYRKPITEADVWKLDTWDQTETLIQGFQKSLEEGSGWEAFSRLAMIFLSFAGPILLNHLLQSMQRGDPAWIGYYMPF
ncbi:hypothetical protein M0R45_013714 [Rubus argutus]|uniref:Uncharacterized protein n=1 Tax=Rubus argutus TaxID=59490 RepID=A0AAW1XK68_RUBAR